MSIVGIDEVGRGSWAGPITACAVLLDSSLVGLRDSKKLSSIQRNKVYKLIKASDACVGVGWAHVQMINEKGLTYSIRFAMNQALKQITKNYDQIIIDGNFNFLAHDPKSLAIIKADETHPAVSAASIIAKVERDNFMKKISKNYNHYGFEKNVGYGTKFHTNSLAEFGPCEIHRINYKPIKALLSI